MLMQNIGVTKKDYYGMLWYFLEWSIERCAQSGPKKLTKTYNKGFPNHSTLINYALGYLFFFPSLFIYFFNLSLKITHTCGTLGIGVIAQSHVVKVNRQGKSFVPRAVESKPTPSFVARRNSRKILKNAMGSFVVK